MTFFDGQTFYIINEKVSMLRFLSFKIVLRNLSVFSCLPSNLLKLKTSQAFLKMAYFRQRFLKLLDTSSDWKKVAFVFEIQYLGKYFMKQEQISKWNSTNSTLIKWIFAKMVRAIAFEKFKDHKSVNKLIFD